MVTTETQTIRNDDSSPTLTTRQVSGGSGLVMNGVGINQYFNSGLTTSIDVVVGIDVHCVNPPAPGFYDSLDGIVSSWNDAARDYFLDPDDPELFSRELMPEITDPNSYNGTATNTTWWLDDDGNRTSQAQNIETVSVQWNRSNTVYSCAVTYTFQSYDRDGTIPLDAAEISYSFELTLTLSNPVSSTDIQNDLNNNLLAQWPLLNDVVYPWRTDGYWSICPMVSRNQVQGDVRPDNRGLIPATMNTTIPTTDQNGNAPYTSASNPPPTGWTYAPNNNDSYGRESSNPGWSGPDDWQPTYTQVPWVDPNAAYYDGSILGAPLTAYPGLEDYFDFRYVDWVSCTDDDGATSYYQKKYGAWRSSVLPQLPGTCTQWLPATADPTNPWFPETGFPIGRNVVGMGNLIYSNKWAETGIRLPSYDHARPYGMDRFMINEQRVICLSGGNSFDGMTVELGSGTTVSNGEYFLVYGTGVEGTDVDGVYKVASGGGTHVTTFTAAYFSPLPSGFTYWDNGDNAFEEESGILGFLRFPTCAPMGGRLAVHSVVNNGDGTCTITTDGAPVPLDWQIDLCDQKMNGLLTNVPVRSTPAATTGSFTIAANYAMIAGAKWVCLYGALDGDPTVSGVARWYWQDTAGKGNAVLMNFALDQRTNQEASRLSTVTDCDGNTPPAGTPSPNYGYATGTMVDICKNFYDCSPYIMVLSPNASDTPPVATGVRYDLGLVTLDQYFPEGSAEIILSNAQMIFSQAMADPLHQTPHATCGDATPPACVQLVESRAILPYASSDATPPDNGAGASQTESPPTPPVDYTMLSPVTHNTGNVEGISGPNAQAIGNLMPTGVWTGC